MILHFTEEESETWINFLKRGKYHMTNNERSHSPNPVLSDYNTQDIDLHIYYTVSLLIY